MNTTKAALLLTLCVAALGTRPLHAQESHSIDLTIHDYGIGIGDSRRVNGLRLNVRDRRLERVNGVNITVWTPTRASGEVNGLALGIPATGAARVNGVGLGVVGVSAEQRLRGIAIGPVGVGAGRELSGLTIGGIGAGTGSDINGIGIGGISLWGARTTCAGS